MYKLTGLARKTDNRLEPVCPKIMDLEMCGYYHPLFIRSCSLLVSNISQCFLVIFYLTIVATLTFPDLLRW